jgi:DNA invertase Pin-like site-specific DNA recombinase
MARRSRGQTNGTPVSEIYTRISDRPASKQAKGKSLDDQLTQCRRYAADHSWVIDHEYTDQMSGRRTERPSYPAMLECIRQLCKDGRAVVVLVAWLDRFGRKLVERIRCRDEPEGLGVPVHSVNEGG